MARWRYIPEYAGRYVVSDTGIIYDAVKRRVKKATVSNSGYASVGLCHNGVRDYYRVHRLVAQAFVPNPASLPEVNHKDEDKLNNVASNLEWCDRIYNCRYGTRTARSAEGHSVAVEQLLPDGTVVKIWKSMAEAGRAGYSFRMVSACCTGTKKSHRGYLWRYATKNAVITVDNGGDGAMLTA